MRIVYSAHAQIVGRCGLDRGTVSIAEHNGAVIKLFSTTLVG